jgi:hypothetical protein
MSIASVDSQRRFSDARRRATYGNLMRFFTRHASTLVSFDAVRGRLRTASEIQRGTEFIPVEAIVGSVGRYRDFTRDFLPRDEALEERWRRIDEALNRLETLPPIDVYKLGDVYFVRDGNHRVSVARANGLKAIEANVAEIPLKAPLTPDMDVDQIILAAEKADFLDHTCLDELRPGATIEFTAPGRYAEVLQHIEGHRWYLGLERDAEVPYSEAVTSWYDTVYLPAIQTIRESGLLSDYPRRTEADLYLWTMRHLAELKEQYSDAVDAQMAAQDLARQRHEPPLNRMVRAVRELVTGENEVSPIVEQLVDKFSERERGQGEARL